LLDVLVNLELLETHKSDEGERLYRVNSPLADCLTKASPLGFLNRVKNFQVTERPLFQSLTSAVREGSNRWSHVFNLTEEKVFHNLYNNHDNLMVFLELMQGYVKPTAPNFIAAFDLSRYKQMCDLGG